MNYDMNRDTLINSLPIHYFFKHEDELNEGFESLKHLEEDVEKEKEYLNYLFHHKDKK